MSCVPKTDANFWKKVAKNVGRSPEECANYYCSCDLSNLDWKDIKKDNQKGQCYFFFSLNQFVFL